MLKNKDGSLYKLRKPNPLVLNQDNWILEQLELHNCKWQPSTTVNEIKPVPKVKELAPEIVPVVSKEVLLIEEPLVIEELIVQEEPTENPIGLPQVILDKMVIMHVMPAVVQIVHDDFYNEDRPSISYKVQVVIDGVVIKRGDLIMEFWTMNDVTIDSIVYPSCYESTKIKFGEYRWWKIQSCEDKSGGTLCRCVPSSIQPDFTS